MSSNPFVTVYLVSVVSSILFMVLFYRTSLYRNNPSLHTDDSSGEEGLMILIPGLNTLYAVFMFLLLLVEMSFIQMTIFRFLNKGTEV